MNIDVERINDRFKTCLKLKMTLDETIKRFTNNAEFERTHGNLQGCLEFRQLAEWLRELQHYKEALVKLGKMDFEYDLKYAKNPMYYADKVWELFGDLDEEAKTNDK